MKEKLLPIFQERSIAKKVNVKLKSPKEADVWEFTLKLKHPEEYTKTAPVFTIEKGLSPETYADRIEKRLKEIRKKPKKKKKRKKKKKKKPKVKIPEKYRSPLVNETTETLASIFRIEPPETWEEIADFYDTTVSKAKAEGDITPQGMWAAK